MVHDSDPRILIGITESWENKDISDAELGLEGYVMFRKDRMGRRGRGVLLYIKYESVVTCRHNIINSSASAPQNAKKIAVKKVTYVYVSMFGRNYDFLCINVAFWHIFARVSAYSG